ncbi:MAG: DNA mismatch repair endonuclease MutL [Candidatus Dormibacteraeota bacterium]|uniref:DNA mismatch repair protein MutL n=1 Tax=Candidatus Dormiibacter inghamiae TaxID=3127013 RepID=A0A934NDA5_9BACT|nr:DNA mismatch repair endonuclease MutL [Candidatus Dormibacteraeota bacterium]MBJ7607415.1 DNA mismatch repair endonuclease MutL [Candidatus Dormibacteraeota bacterium]
MTIRRLPQQVADAIAAGEVVERPASALKELIENALDAGSRRLGIEVRGAGRTLIRVVDDGAGIPAEELELAFQRHATSKVRSLADLEAISSLGFRGEALASLAAVADVECRSRGRRIRLLAGEVVESTAAVPVPGTALEVRDLFANTPARLRFLKSDATELAACLKVVQAYALLYPEVRFEYANEGRLGLRTPGRGDATAAAAAVLGSAVAAELMPVEAEGIRGLTSQPRLHRGSRDGLLLAVNRRPIASRALGYAVEECYLGRLERGRYPITVLALTVPPSELDVNVHPAKREVRFRDDRVIFGRLQRAIRAALNGSQPYHVAEAPSTAGSPWRTPQVRSAPAFAGLDSVLGEAFPAAPRAEGPLRPLGQVQDAYLVAESAEGIVLVDQHAAHERVLYNRFLAQLRAGSGASQALLLPETVELEPAQTAAASDHRDWLAALGFELEEFGPQTVKLRAAPLATPAARARDALSDLLQTLARSLPQAALENAAASLACHSAVRFGDRLEPVEQRRLLEELEQAEESITCPHGRPTRLLLDWPQLKRHFRRNY